MRTSVTTHEAILSTALVLTLSSSPVSSAVDATESLDNETRMTFPQLDAYHYNTTNRENVTLSPTQLLRTLLQDGRSTSDTASPHTLSSTPERGPTAPGRTTESYSLMTTSQPDRSAGVIESSSITYSSATPPPTKLRTTESQVYVRDYGSADRGSVNEGSTVLTTTSAIRDRQFVPLQMPNDYGPVSRRHSSTTPSRGNENSLHGYTRAAFTSTVGSPLADVKTSTLSTVNADEVVFLNRNRATTRANTPSTTLSKVLWNGFSGTTSTSSPLPVNVTTQQNLIDFKDVITAPEFKCPDDQKRDMEGKCQVKYDGYEEKKN